MGIATRLLVAVAIAAAALLIARLLTAALRRVRDRANVGAPLVYIIERVVGYAVVLGGFLVALSTLGVNLTSLAVFAGALGVGVGLGLQGVVREFVSGLVVIFDPVIGVGDFVELDDGTRGEVAEIGPRAARLRTNDGLHVVIPNSKLIETRVLNWTHKGGTRRIHVPFGVAYGADKAKVRDAVLAAARALPFTLPDTDTRKTQVWMTAFGDSAMSFELVVWPTMDAVRRPSAMHAAYTWAIDDALRAAGVEVPFPQTDLRIRSLFGREGDEALTALRLEPLSTAAKADAPTDSRNDAAREVVEDAEWKAEEDAVHRSERP